MTNYILLGLLTFIAGIFFNVKYGSKIKSFFIQEEEKAIAAGRQLEEKLAENIKAIKDYAKDTTLTNISVEAKAIQLDADSFAAMLDHTVKAKVLECINAAKQKGGLTFDDLEQEIKTALKL